MNIKEEAIKFANTSKKQQEECPRGVLNPGLYYGFVAGANAQKEEILKLKEENELLKKQLAIAKANFNLRGY